MSRCEHVVKFEIWEIYLKVYSTPREAELEIGHLKDVQPLGFVSTLGMLIFAESYRIFVFRLKLNDFLDRPKKGNQYQLLMIVV